MGERIPSTNDNARIHDESENISTNVSDNREFADVIAAAMSRRGILQGSLAGAAASFLAPQALASD